MSIQIMRLTLRLTNGDKVDFYVEDTLSDFFEEDIQSDKRPWFFFEDYYFRTYGFPKHTIAGLRLEPVDENAIPEGQRPTFTEMGTE